jgi:ABC-2 type transport system permease protein
MPDGLSWFAANQPLTPMVDAVRGLVLGEPAGSAIAASLAWSAVLTVVFAALSVALYRRG